jgi:DNA-binding NtrC family response regulator
VSKTDQYHRGNTPNTGFGKPSPVEEPSEKRIQVSQPASSIFVVDDEPVIASTLASILQMHGFRARCFTSPLEALKAAHSEAPDILLSDVIMPTLSGINLAIRMMALSPNCQVLLLSGQAATSDLLKAAREMGHTFPLLLKPVHPIQMLLEIGKLAESHAANACYPALNQTPS